MATDTLTVKVSDMATGALLRITTTAGEALRASQLPTAGMTIADRIAGVKPTEAQLKARQAKAQRNADRLALLEIAQQTAQVAEVARVGSEMNIYTDLNTDWQAGYDY